MQIPHSFIRNGFTSTNWSIIPSLRRKCQACADTYFVTALICALSSPLPLPWGFFSFFLCLCLKKKSWGVKSFTAPHTLHKTPSSVILYLHNSTLCQNNEWDRPVSSAARAMPLCDGESGFNVVGRRDCCALFSLLPCAGLLIKEMTVLLAAAVVII